MIDILKIHREFCGDWMEKHGHTLTGWMSVREVAAAIEKDYPPLFPGDAINIYVLGRVLTPKFPKKFTKGTAYYRFG